MKNAERVQNLSSDKSTIFICGRESSLCKRSEYLNQTFLAQNDIICHEIHYSTDDQAIHNNHTSIYANSTHVSDFFGNHPSVNLASIDVGEIWILLRLLARNELSGIEFYYLTPDDYGGTGVGECMERRQISISGGRWRGLPGLLTPWNIDNIDFRQFSFLGFDVHRLGSIDSYEGFPDNLNRTYILADPPTAPYWLERSLRDNHQLITEVFQDSHSITPVNRMAGMCPSTVHSQLRDIRSRAPREQRWCLLPLGPKIQTLGAIIFTCNQLEVDTDEEIEPTVGVLYDFPKPNVDITRIETPPKYYWKFCVEAMM